MFSSPHEGAILGGCRIFRRWGPARGSRCKRWDFEGSIHLLLTVSWFTVVWMVPTTQSCCCELRCPPCLLCHKELKSSQTTIQNQSHDVSVKFLVTDTKISNRMIFQCFINFSFVKKYYLGNIAFDLPSSYHCLWWYFNYAEMWFSLYVNK